MCRSCFVELGGAIAAINLFCRLLEEGQSRPATTRRPTWRSPRSAPAPIRFSAGVHSSHLARRGAVEEPELKSAQYYKDEPENDMGPNSDCQSGEREHPWREDQPQSRHKADPNFPFFEGRNCGYGHDCHHYCDDPGIPGRCRPAEPECPWSNEKDAPMMAANPFIAVKSPRLFHFMLTSLLKITNAPDAFHPR